MLADPVGRAAWLRHPEVTRAGGTGEAGRDVSERMQEAVREIAARHPAASVAIVGHSTANRLLLAATLGMPLAGYRRLVLDNASICVHEVDGEDLRWLRINDVSHLARSAIETPRPWPGRR